MLRSLCVAGSARGRLARSSSAPRELPRLQRGGLAHVPGAHACMHACLPAPRLHHGAQLGAQEDVCCPAVPLHAGLACPPPVPVCRVEHQEFVGSCLSISPSPYLCRSLVQPSRRTPPPRSIEHPCLGTSRNKRAPPPAAGAAQRIPHATPLQGQHRPLKDTCNVTWLRGRRCARPNAQPEGATGRPGQYAHQSSVTHLDSCQAFASSCPWAPLPPVPRSPQRGGRGGGGGGRCCEQYMACDSEGINWLWRYMQLLDKVVNAVCIK